jgi:2',3'-cyclic-nucleotide 2'-phosphodiesterase (5'-nucleotidase family)
MRAAGEVILVVDSGDLFFDAAAAPGDVSKAIAKARVIARVYKRMGVTAITVGDGDLLNGMAFLQQGAGQSLPLISANLVDLQRKRPIFPPFVIQEVSGIRIAFFGLSNPSAPSSTIKGKKIEVMIQDPVETARTVVGELKGKADLIILLSDLGTDQDILVARACPGIRFILGGHEGRAAASPVQEGETFIVQSYRKGMYLGKLSLILEGAGSPFQDEGRVGRLQEEMDELNRRIDSLKSTKERNPHLDIGRAIEAANQQKAELQKKIEQAKSATVAGNRFRWTLEPIATSLPEDGEVLQWIKASGISGD